MTRVDGAYNDGYADKLSLVLPEPGATATAITAFGAAALLARSRRRVSQLAAPSTSTAFAFAPL